MGLFGRKDEAPKPSQTPQPFASFGDGMNERNFLTELDSFKKQINEEMKTKVKKTEERYIDARRRAREVYSEQKGLETTGALLKTIYESIKRTANQEFSNVKSLEMEYGRMLSLLGMSDDQIMKRIEEIKSRSL